MLIGEVLGKPLTPRQRDALIGRAQGKAVKEIAHDWGIAFTTVHETLQNAYARLGAVSSIEVIFAAIRRGDITLEEVGLGPGDIAGASQAG
jgi:DNA-binding NarL/FixJ family response regulator